MATTDSEREAKVIPIGAPSRQPRVERGATAATEMGEWEGGYWRKNKAGRTVYYIRKRIDGRLYEVSTRATGRRAALDHLARFESDPSGYTPHGALGRDRLVLTVELAKEFTDWSEAPRSKGGKQNTRLWVNHQVRVLAWWRGVIGDKDLRRVDVAADIEEPAAKEGGTAEKIRVIKSLYGWLRKRKRVLSPADDPTSTPWLPHRRPRASVSGTGPSRESSSWRYGRSSTPSSVTAWTSRAAQAGTPAS